MQISLNELFNAIPIQLIQFILVVVFSLLLGLSQRHIHTSTDEKHLFGADRTFTFIGILGYILLVATPGEFYLYLAGGSLVAGLLTVYYIYKIKNFDNFGITTILEAALTYCLPLVIVTLPFWLFLLYAVVLLVFTESKSAFISVSEKLNRDEFLTFAKFIIMAGLILPVVPDTPIVGFLSITPYSIALAVVVISSISYISYLLRKFVFKEGGLILSGILGGLYSSTAATVVLSKKLKDAETGHAQYAATIIMATGMMYLRIGLIMFIFNRTLFIYTAWAMITLTLVSCLTGGILYYIGRNQEVAGEPATTSDKNPLEIKVALIFTAIYVLFTFITFYTIQHFGIRGLNILSLFVGVVDVDPFLLNLFQGKYQVTMSMLGTATLTTLISNNLVKMTYAVFLAGRNKSKFLFIAFGIVIALNLIMLLFI
jgi:uncharacterized membrane protein (DUF4010 family)